MVELRPVDAEAFAELCDNMRAPDMQELHAAHGRPCREIVAESIERSIEPLAAWDQHDRLVAIFGRAPIGPLLTDVASPWLLGTPLMTAHASSLVRLSRQHVTAWRETHPRLVNFVDARNTASIRYLRAVGFVIDEPLPYGVAELPFHRFHQGLT